MYLEDSISQRAPMSLEDAIASRRTVREFLPDPVPNEVLEKVIEAGSAAPSPLNSQPWHFYVVTGEMRDKLIEKIRKFPAYLADILALYPNEFSKHISEEHISKFAKNLGGAPSIILVAVPKKTNKYAHKVDLIACAAAIQNMQLMAWSLGLGTVCLTSALWVESEIASFLGLKDLELVTVMPIGYRKSDPEPKPRSTNVTWIGSEA